jgi:hypothetical protein
MNTIKCPICSSDYCRMHSEVKPELFDAYFKQGTIKALICSCEADGHLFYFLIGQHKGQIQLIITSCYHG